MAHYCYSDLVNLHSWNFASYGVVNMLHTTNMSPYVMHRGDVNAGA